MIRVLIVDDQRMVRRGLTLLLSAEDDIEVVAEADDGGQALRLAAQHQPDVVLMDIRMPGMDGLEASRMLREASDAGPAVVMLTTFGEDAYVDEALRAGAAGFVLKDSDPDLLVDAVRAAAAGKGLLDPDVTRGVIRRWTRDGPAPDPAFAAALDTLSRREREVLDMVAAGATNEQVSAALHVERTTVKTHVRSILRKLGLRDRVEAVVRMHQAGLVPPPAGGGQDHPAG